VHRFAVVTLRGAVLLLMAGVVGNASRAK